MGLPIDWRQVVEGKTFVIHLKQEHGERFETCDQRMKDAGYSHYEVFDAVHGQDPTAWAKHCVAFDGSWMVPRVAGCMLSHLGVWRKMIDEGIEFATIFEDDALFHSGWHELAIRYYQATPKDCDMIFMGHHCGNVGPQYHVVRAPVFCLNAYILTLDGAKKLYEMITQYPYDDNHAVDMMLVRLMYEQLTNAPQPREMPKLQWYVWNAEMFPDPIAEPLIHPHLVHKDKGLVFQQWYP